MSNIGRPFSASSIAKYFKNEFRRVSNETVLHYIHAFEDAFLFYPVRRYDLVEKKLLSVNEKYYIADHGLREAIYGRNEKDLDQILENIVCLELLRRGYKIAIGRIGERMIDFICERHGEKLYIQVSYLLASAETISREFDVLLAIPDNYPKYVVSLDEFNMSRDGIKHRNIREFLLMQNWE